MRLRMCKQTLETTAGLTECAATCSLLGEVRDRSDQRQQDPGVAGQILPGYKRRAGKQRQRYEERFDLSHAARMP
jgi:hypothetical protein